MFLILGEHLGADIPGVFSSGDDQHSALHHYGKTFTMTTLKYSLSKLYPTGKPRTFDLEEMFILFFYIFTMLAVKNRGSKN